MSEQQPITVDFLAQTCAAHPSQWSGLTAPCPCCGARRAVYVRFRRRALRVGVGRTLDNAVDDENAVFIWAAPTDRVEHGRMSFSELRELVPAWLTLPAAECEIEALEALGW